MQPTTLLSTVYDGEFYVPMGKLVTLGETSIPKADLLVRPIVPAYLDSLLTIEGKVEPIIVQNSNIGWIILDGYHRYYRALILARVAYWKPVKTANFNVLSYVSTLSFADAQEQEYIRKTSINVKAYNATDYNDLIDYVFKANLQHGKDLPI